MGEFDGPRKDPRESREDHLPSHDVPNSIEEHEIVSGTSSDSQEPQTELILKYIHGELDSEIRRAFELRLSTDSILAKQLTHEVERQRIRLQRMLAFQFVIEGEPRPTDPDWMEIVDTFLSLWDRNEERAIDLLHIERDHLPENERLIAELLTQAKQDVFLAWSRAGQDRDPEGFYPLLVSEVSSRAAVGRLSSNYADDIDGEFPDEPLIPRPRLDE